MAIVLSVCALVGVLILGTGDVKAKPTVEPTGQSLAQFLNFNYKLTIIHFLQQTKQNVAVMLIGQIVYIVRWIASSYD